MTVYRFNDYELDTSSHRLIRKGESIGVEPKVFDLLRYLIEHRERMISRQELFEKLWPGQIVSDTSLSNQVKAARKAVDDNGKTQSIIRTVHGRGYQFVADVMFTSAGDSTDSPVLPSLDESVPNPDKPSIAVLPFENLSGDREQDYFSDGITEDIITELSRFSILDVVARHSSFALKGVRVDIEEVAEKLDVQYVVEGSVRRAGNRVRITAQLIDARTEKHIWGDRYDRELDDLFAVQDEVTRAIVATLAAQLGKTVSENAARKAPNSIKSYEYLLQANRRYYRFNPDDNIAAARLYEKAIERDPQFSRAYAGLANTYTTDYFLGWLRTENALQNGLDYSRKALAFDSDDALARIVLAWALIGKGSWEEAELELDRVLKLKPGDADILAEAGNGFKAVGRFDVGIALLEEAIRLNPLFPDSYQRWLGQAFYRAGRYQEAINTLRAVVADGWGYGVLAASFARAGELEPARNALQKFITQRQKELESSGMPASTPTDLLGNYRDNFRTEAHWQHLLDGLHMAGLAE